MEVLNPTIVIRKNGRIMRWLKKPYSIMVEAGVRCESATTRYAPTNRFGETYCVDKNDIIEAIPRLRTLVDWDRKMLVIDTTGQFRDVMNSEND